MNTTAIGRAAEEAAAKYLEGLGYTVAERNWRTRWCEIDLIMQKASVVYFVEVKYRSSDKWGSGIEYITPRKLQQMRFAAEFWIAKQKRSIDYRLGGIEVTGPALRIGQLLLA